MCGRPVFETDLPEVTQPTRPELPQISVAALAGPMPVGFGNPVALRVAILMSLGTLFVEMVPGMSLLFILWTLAGGWCAVLLYRRLTGYALSVKAGARLGSITGVLTFLSQLVVFTLTVVVIGKDVVLQQIKQGNPQASQVFNDPPALIAAILMALLILFAIVVGTCAAGGALGARFLGRNSANTRV